MSFQRVMRVPGIAAAPGYPASPSQTCARWDLPGPGRGPHRAAAIPPPRRKEIVAIANYVIAAASQGRRTVRHVGGSDRSAPCPAAGSGPLPLACQSCLAASMLSRRAARRLRAAGRAAWLLAVRLDQALHEFVDGARLGQVALVQQVAQLGLGQALIALAGLVMGVPGLLALGLAGLAGQLLLGLLGLFGLLAGDAGPLIVIIRAHRCDQVP